MKTPELFSGSRRPFLGDLLRRLFQHAGVVGGLVALVALGSCGKNATFSPDSKNTGDESGEQSALVSEGIEREGAEDDLENEAANERAWQEELQKGSFSAEYQAGETDASLTAGQTVVLIAAGDIATSGSNDTKTAALVDRIPGTVVTLGDNAYSKGSTSNYNSYYAPTWGKFKARTRPSPGNHDYETSGASGYFKYFGSNAGPSGRGYYSFNYGDWHIVSLNSNISMSTGSTQEKWLKADLAANPNRCTLAYWHHPRFSSGDHGSSTKSKGVWTTLQNAGAEIVLTGHDHDYERFAPMLADGKKDLARGIRSFVVGTGGTSLRSMGKTTNSEARNSSTHGVLKLTLEPGSYKWEFIPVAGKTYRDAGSGTCR